MTGGGRLCLGQVSKASPLFCRMTACGLWHLVGICSSIMWRLGGVVEVTELSCIAMLPLLAGGETMADRSLDILQATAPATAGLSCGAQDLDGDEMGPTWAQVRLALGDWPLWPVSSLSLLLGCCSVSPSTSCRGGGGSDSANAGRLSSLYAFFSAWSSSSVTRGRLMAVGDGEGDSASVQLSLRFWKSN